MTGHREWPPTPVKTDTSDLPVKAKTVGPEAEVCKPIATVKVTAETACRYTDPIAIADDAVQHCIKTPHTNKIASHLSLIYSLK